MKALVVDASVVAKWFFPEPDSTAAVKLLSRRFQLIAPDLLWSEFGNIVWKRVGRGEITADEGSAVVEDFLRVPVESLSAARLLPAALELAVTTGRTVYDSLYLALAMERSCHVATADERMVNALAGTPLGKYLRLVTTVR